MKGRGGFSGGQETGSGCKDGRRPESDKEEVMNSGKRREEAVLAILKRILRTARNPLLYIITTIGIARGLDGTDLGGPAHSKMKKDRAGVGPR